LADLASHWEYLEAEWQAAVDAPLSQRKVLLVAMLIDAYVDRLFAADHSAEDVLEFRRARAAASPALGLVMQVAMQAGAQLRTEAVPVPIADYAALAVEDFMVSLYNDHSVQRVVMIASDGERFDAQEILADAMAALQP
jgi:hypothetical protein